MTDATEVVVSSRIAGRDAGPITTIQRLTCEAFGFTLSELRSATREKRLVAARQVAMYLCKIETSKSFPQIAKAFGGRNHTTVLYACERVELMISEPPGSGLSSQWKPADCDLVREKVAYIRGALAEIFPDHVAPTVQRKCRRLP